MAGKPLKKPSMHGVTIRQLVEDIPEGCSMPGFEQKPVTLALQEGRNAIFRAVVCGDPKPEVRWQCGQDDLSNSGKYQISSSPDSKEHVLQINKLTGEDTGLYRCTAANAYGEATCSARLTVIEVGFRKKRKRQNEPQEDLRQQLMEFRKMLKKRAPPPAQERKVDMVQVWQLLLAADRKDYERLCLKYGIMDFRGVLRKLQEMRQARDDKMAQYVNTVSNLKHMMVTKDGTATFELELDLKDSDSKVYLYKDGEMTRYGSDSQAKRYVRRLGKRYQFQIQDLWPEDAGIYQVKVEDAEIFSTELDASVIPPRVVVPLAEARCEEQGDAVFECVLSNPCPNATWSFQHRPLQPSDKYEVFVSPDGLTHQLVVRGARLSDMGPYSLDTGLYTSSAWLVVEEGKDKGLLTTSADRQVQLQGAETSESGASRGTGGEGGRPREQGPTGGSLQGAGLAGGLQLTDGPDRGGLGGHGYTLMGDTGAADSAWGPGQAGKGLLEAEEGRAAPPGENQAHREGGWDGSVPGGPHPQGEGPGPGLGLTEGHLPDGGGDSGRDRHGGTAGSRRPRVGGLEGSEEGQEQLWGAQLGPGTGKDLQGSQAGSGGSWSEGEVMEILQGQSLDEVGGGDGLSRESLRGAARAAWGSGTGLGEAGDSNAPGGPGTLEAPGGRGFSSKAGRGSETWGPQGGGDDAQGEARGHRGSVQSLGQTSAGKDLQEPPESGGRKVLLGKGSLGAEPEGSRQEAASQGQGGLVGGGRGYATSPGGAGGPGSWERGPHGVQGKEGQQTVGALAEAGAAYGSPESSQGRTAGQRGAGEAGRGEAESTDPWGDTSSSRSRTGAQPGPGGPGSAGGEGGVGGTQVAGLVGSGQEVDARSHRLIGSPGRGAQGPGGTLGGTDGSSGPGAVGSEADFREGTRSSRGRGPGDEMGRTPGLGGPGGVGCSYGDDLGHFRGSGLENGAGAGDGPGVPGQMGSGGLAGLKSSSGGLGGGPMDEARTRPGAGDASRGQGHAGPGGRHSSDGGLESLGTVGTVGEGHVGAEPGASGRIRPQGPTGDAGGFKASGALGAFGEGGPGATEPGSVRAAGKVSDGEGTRGPEAQASCPGAGSGSLPACGSGNVLGSGDGSGIPGPQQMGGRAAYGGGSRGLGPEGMGPGGEVGLRDGSGGLGGMGSGAEAGHRDGTEGAGEVRSANEAGYRRGLGAPEGMGSGGKAGDKDGLGASARTVSGAEAGHRDGTEGAGKVQSANEAGYRRGLGAPEGMGSGGKAGDKDGLGASGRTVSGAEAGHRDGTEGAGKVQSANEAGYRRGLGAPEGMGSGGKAGDKDGLGASGRTVSGAEAGHRGGSGGAGDRGPESEKTHRDSPGQFGVAGSPAGVGPEGGPRGREAMGHGSGGGTASEGSSGGARSQGGPDRSRGTGLVNGASPGVGSGVAGVVGAADRRGSANSGAPGALGAVGSQGKAGVREWQDGPGTLWYAEGAPPSWGRVPSSSSPDGQGAVEGDTAALESRQGGDLWKAGPGTADRGGAAGRGGQASWGAEDSLLGDGRLAAAQGSPKGTGQALDSSHTLRERDRSASECPSGRRASHARAPGSRVSSSLHGEDATSRGTQKGPEGGRGWDGAAGQGEAGGRRGPRSLDNKGSRPGRGGSAGPGDAGWTCDGLTQSEAEVRAAEKGVADVARGRGQLPTGGDRGGPGEILHEDGSRKPVSHLGSRRGGTESRLDVGGQEGNATQRPRSRHKPGIGGSSEETRGPLGHFSQGLADTEAQLGEDAVLSCTLSRDLGPGAWFKDGVKLGAEDGLVFERDGLVHRLLIAHVQGTQAGRYAFVVGNQQSEATLTVKDPPVIAPEVTERLREPLVVKAGKPLTVKIPFQSRLPVQATWRKDGARVEGGSGRGAQVALCDDFTRLCLPSTSRKDGGQYSVTLRSKGGSAQAELTLHVIDKSQPPQGPLEVQHGHGAGVSLRWRPPRDDGGRAVERYVVERRQASRSSWLKVGEAPADSTTFTDAQVEKGRKYAFRVRAVTSEGAGEALESEEVLVASEALPGPPSSPAILSASSRGITLTWTAPRGPGRAHILGYLIEKRKKGSNTWAAVTDQPVSERKWTVVDVRPGCQYEFRVTALAPAGPGEPSPPSDAVFARDPMRPPGPVRDLQVTDTSHTSITLHWAPPDTQDGDDAQGYVVELCSSGSLQWGPCHPGAVTVTTYTAKGLRPREGYFVRVTAVNDGGRGQPTALDELVQAMPVSVCPKFLMDSNAKDSLMVRVGDTIRVPVSFEAAPMPEVTWLKDGLPLTKRSVTSSEEGLTQLLVPVASLSDSGLYTVVLRSLQGKEAAYSFRLRVAEYPQAPGPIRLQENVPGTVTAEWEPSPDEARGVPLHYTVLTRSSGHGPWREAADRVHTNRFTLLGVVPGHEYHFRVVAKNELGASRPSETSQPWCIPRQRDRFTVKAPSYREPSLSQKPSFLVGLRPHLLPRGCECCMSCAVRGSPRPHVTWFKDGQSLAGNPVVYSTDMLGVCSLVIPSVTPEDSGQYKAVAENALGQAVSTATLIVTEPSS